MTPNKSQKELEKRIKKSGMKLAELTPAQGIRLMLDFYRDVRADGCELDSDGDMLLFQWGTYSFSGEEPTFQFDITRQFIEKEDEDDQGLMSQLSFTFHYTPSSQLDAVKSDNRWCSTPDELTDFETFITESPAYKAVADATPVKVTLELGDV